jgi:hypothetical protein
MTGDPAATAATPLLSPKSPMISPLHMALLFIRLRRAYGEQEIDGSPTRRAWLI